MAKSSIPSVRALDEIKANITSKIYNIDEAEVKEIDAKISKLSTSVEKTAVAEIVNAIQKLAFPYKIEHVSLCNVRQWDGHLRFDLQFDPSATPDGKVLMKRKDAIASKRKRVFSELSKWYERSLYKIANRQPIEQFDHHELR